ncbi:ABC transporter ATP-binding protein [Acinetobacter rathckeae]|uniref:ABC transporter ATP-binding protein n=1 Tax=Acinetobacter rathckeae TaxID=2605272 RepID=UPI0018A2C020|nr:ABC transporter ATP-binding protein [Acinetobacter rathckeae]MBF7688227.1 ABC transporter ATP-binding protein [Acinetobacter rathckeae]MBF7695254.1 ABC transporter ATP-binding protein [Acinetobacter rathckeae]
MNHLTLHKIKKSWGTKTALDNISFDIHQGEFIALLGPSGCGKTTLLRTIAGLESADEGEILLKEKEVSHLGPADRNLSMVFQSYALFPHLTIRENLLFGLKARKEDHSTFEHRLHETAKLLELDAFLDHLPAQLSGGQQQRVALGRAVISKRPLCLMDEPLSNLDAKLRQTMRREIRQLQQKLNLTLIYVTHDQTEAMTMADRIVLMNNGHIEQIGHPAELYNNPCNGFVAQFIGAPAMNIIPLNAVNHGYGLSHSAFIPHIDATDISMGLRAEAIQVVPIAQGKMTATVISYEYLGSDTLLLCNIDAQPKNQVTIKLNGLHQYVVGQTIGLDWKHDAQYIFTGQTLNRYHSKSLQQATHQNISLLFQEKVS